MGRRTCEEGGQGGCNFAAGATRAGLASLLACMALLACDQGAQPTLAGSAIVEPHAETAIMPAPEDAPNTGHAPPGPAFLLDLTKGFDPETMLKSDFAIEDNWISAAFDPRNLIFGEENLRLRVQRRPYRDKPYAGAEMLRQGFYGYGRYEVVMKPAAGSGVVSAFFTHTFGFFNGDPHDEIDIEFLGKNTRSLHLNYFKAGKPKGSIYADVPFDWSEDFHLYAFEWTPNAIRWYADDQLIHEETGSPQILPSATQRPIIQMWTPGAAAVGWVGRIDWKGDWVSAYKCISHVPRGGSGPQCSDAFQASVSAHNP